MNKKIYYRDSKGRFIKKPVKETRSTYTEDLRLEKQASEEFRNRKVQKQFGLVDLKISMADIDKRQRIDDTRQWRGIMDGEASPDQYVFVGFFIGESPEREGEIEEDDRGEIMWVYKSNYTVVELKEGLVTPEEIIQEIAEEQPNIEIAGLCKYVRDLPPTKS